MEENPIRVDNKCSMRYYPPTVWRIETFVKYGLCMLLQIIRARIPRCNYSTLTPAILFIASKSAELCKAPTLVQKTEINKVSVVHVLKPAGA